MMDGPEQKTSEIFVHKIMLRHFLRTIKGRRNNFHTKKNTTNREKISSESQLFILTGVQGTVSLEFRTTFHLICQFLSILIRFNASAGSEKKNNAFTLTYACFDSGRIP